MVSVIILSYNTVDLLEQCLASVISHMKHIDHEVIVVDNASKDTSVSMVKKKFPTVILLENERNVGFGKAVNQAAERAKGGYLLLLNSDALMHTAGITQMLSYLKEHEDVAVVGGKLENANGASSRSYGKFYLLPEVFRMLFFDKEPVARRSISRVDWVSGGYMLIRKAAFTAVGGFDEHFFMYLEDMELCYRMRQKGYGVVYYPDASVRHLGQGSSNRSFAIIHIYKGLLYFYKRHRTFPEYMALKFLLLDKAISGFVAGMLTGNEYLKKTYRKAFDIVI